MPACIFFSCSGTEDGGCLTSLCLSFYRKNASRSWHGRNLTASQTLTTMRFLLLLRTRSSRPAAAGEESARKCTPRRMLSATYARSDYTSAQNLQLAILMDKKSRMAVDEESVKFMKAVTEQNWTHQWIYLHRWWMFYWTNLRDQRWDCICIS